MSFSESIITYKNYNIKTITVDDTVWFRGKDIATVLGYKRTTNAVATHVSEKDKAQLKNLIYNETSKRGYNELHTIYITQEGLICLLISSRQLNKEAFLSFCKDMFDINYTLITRLYKEQESIGQIIQVFRHLNPIRQHIVGSYRIDLYFPLHKIAIECDELGHADRNQTYEKTRQNYIEQTLQCKFLRYNPDDKDFSIFEFIHKLLLELS